MSIESYEYRPSATATKHVLPFEKLDPTTFERLCLWLVRAKGYLQPEHYGLAGTDHGRDIVAYHPVNMTNLFYFQCKRTSQTDTESLKREVDKIVELSTDSLSLKPKGIIFVITCRVSATIRDKLKSYCANNQLECEFWAQTEIDMYVKEHSHIVSEFFDIRDHTFTHSGLYRKKDSGKSDPALLSEASEMLQSMPFHVPPEPVAISAECLVKLNSELLQQDKVVSI